MLLRRSAMMALRANYTARPTVFCMASRVSTIVPMQQMHFAKKGKDKGGSIKKDAKEAEKANLKEEFADMGQDDIKNDFADTLESHQDSLDEKLASIKSGRASPRIFDDVEVKAYGELQVFQDVAQTVVQGNNNLIVKVFDESVKDEVLKAL